MKTHLEKLDINLHIIMMHVCPIPPWYIKNPTIIMHRSPFKKGKSTQMFIRKNWWIYDAVYQPVYTSVYTVYISVYQCIQIRWTSVCCSSDWLRVFQQECSRIKLHIDSWSLCTVFSSGTNRNSQFLICTDCMSCLPAYESMKTDHPMSFSIIEKADLLKTKDFDVL